MTVSGKTYFKGKKTIEYAKKHYNCNSIKGVMMEDDGGEGTAGAHWEKSWVNDEIMAGIVTGKTDYVSILTLKYFEDSGWYLP